MYNKMLIAVDGSEHSFRAADEAVKIASLAKECVIDIVLVAEFSKSKDEILHSQGKEELEFSRQKILFPLEEKLKAEGLTYNITILHGEPGNTIIKHANEGHYDLAVVVSGSLNVVMEMVLGSVSHKLEKRVECPALNVTKLNLGYAVISKDLPTKKCHKISQELITSTHNIS